MAALPIGITGAAGFLGWHLRAHLHGEAGLAAVCATRETFAAPDALARFAGDVAAIVHLAGVNRGEPEEVRRGNEDAARALVAALEAARASPHLVYANSTHVGRPGPYGESKRAAAAILGEWAAASGARFTDLTLPHVFGEHGRAHYNSAVATFCHQLSRGEPPRILEDGEVELLHAQRVAARIVEIIRGAQAGAIRLPGTRMRASALLERLRAIAAAYPGEAIPALADALELDLFNTYRSYLFPQRYPVATPPRSDARGMLFEAVRSLNGGQCFFSTTRPGVTRGNHYHRRKLERFLVVQGEAVIRVRRLCTGQVQEFTVSGAEPGYVDMPTLHTHNITNTGKGELLTMFWSHEIFDPARPDTFAEPV